MNHPGHFIKKCSKCGGTIIQCRCMDANKPVEYGICTKCATDNISDVTKVLGCKPKTKYVYNVGDKVHFVNSRHHSDEEFIIGPDPVIENVKAFRWEPYPLLHQEIITDVHNCWIDSSNYDSVEDVCHHTVVVFMNGIGECQHCNFVYVKKEKK
jgi:hypothetical protein